MATSAAWPAGDDWAITSYVQTDGDTLRAHLMGFRPPKEPWTVGPYEVTPSDRYARRPVIVRTRRDLPGVAGRCGPPLRLITLNAPEKKNPIEWGKAVDDLAAWLRGTWLNGGLRVETWEGEGAFSRMLADVYAANDRTNTASQHMLRLGWSPYLGTRLDLTTK